MRCIWSGKRIILLYTVLSGQHYLGNRRRVAVATDHIDPRRIDMLIKRFLVQSVEDYVVPSAFRPNSQPNAPALCIQIVCRSQALSQQVRWT